MDYALYSDLLQVTYKQPDGAKFLVIFALICLAIFTFLFFGYYKARIFFKGQASILLKYDATNKKVILRISNNHSNKPLEIKRIQIIKNKNSKQQKFAPKQLDQLTLLGGTSHQIVLPLSTISNEHEKKFRIQGIVYQGISEKELKSRELTIRIKK